MTQFHNDQTKIVTFNGVIRTSSACINISNYNTNYAQFLDLRTTTDEKAPLTTSPTIHLLIRKSTH